MRLQEGLFLQNGKYRIIKVLGQGGFGITYLAENVLLERKVAVKEFFPKDFCNRDNSSHITVATVGNVDTVNKLKSRFIKEARNIAKLDHKGIIKIHDVFEENNTAYYVMDYIDGENLNEIVKQNGPLPEDKALKYISEIGSSLEYIHSKNMTHFDVKPANIIISKKDDLPILIDFGLSKQYDKEGSATSTMMHGVSQGYSPIELYNIGSIQTFSPQSDIYSLGATLFFLLTGKVPPNASELLEKELIFPAFLSQSIKESIKRATKLKRSERFYSVNEFLQSFSQLGNDNSNTSFPNEPFQTRNQVEETKVVNSQTKEEKQTDTNLISHKNIISISEEDLQKQIPGEKNAKVNSYSKFYLIGAFCIITILLIGLLFFIKKDGPKENDFVSQETNFTLEQQISQSQSKEVEAPNYDTYNSNSTLTVPKIKKVSQKYVDPVAETNEWIKINGIETFSPLLDAAPSFYNYDETLSSLGQLPVPQELDSQYLRYYKQDNNYNYFAYGSESYVEPGVFRLLITNKDNTKLLYDYKFNNYIYPPKVVESDRQFVDYKVSGFTLQNDILYFSYYHNTYAYSSQGMNGYISALDTKTGKLLWTTKPLVCNANFIIDGDYIITGYGFTDEPDFLYILDKNNGAIISKTSLANGPDIIGINGNHIFVRTYSYEYDFTFDK